MKAFSIVMYCYMLIAFLQMERKLYDYEPMINTDLKFKHICLLVYHYENK